MSEKTDLIKKMLELQHKFMDKEQKDGVDQQEYFAPESGDVLEGYRQEYRDMAMKVVELAHAEKGSHR